MKKCSKCSKTFDPTLEPPGKEHRCPHCKHENDPASSSPPETRSASSSPALDPMAAYKPPEPSSAPAEAPAESPAPEQQTPKQSMPEQPASNPAPQVAIAATGDRADKLHARRRSNLVPRILAGIAVVGAIALVVWLVRGGTEPAAPAADNSLRIADISKLSFGELSKISIQLSTTDPQRWKGKVTYQSIEAPEGLSVSQAGEISWQPTEEQGPGEHAFVVEVRPSDESSTKAVRRKFVFKVNERNRPPSLTLTNETASAGKSFQIQVQGEDPDFPANELNYSILNAAETGAQIDAKSGTFSWTPSPELIGKVVKFHIEVKETGDKPLRAAKTLSIRVIEGTGLASTNTPRPAVKPKPASKGLGLKPLAPGKPAPSMADSGSKPQPNSEIQNQLLTSYKENKLFRDYAALRALRAGKVWKELQPKLKAGMGEEKFKQLQTWLDDNPILKEELLIALSPEDNAVRVFQIVDEIRTKHPEKAVTYGNLTMATALVWDNPRAIYDYTGHQRRSKASLPDGRLDAIANFDYIVATENFMQGRGQWLPWEFLVHVVNHKTPLNERQWALQNYVSKRAMFGSCYKHVPYDTEMLETQSQVAKMNGKVYNLPNLTKFGGVCAHQADFASRVGKSIGVPAAYVSGASNSGERHAWVMWVELQAVSQRSIRFNLESFGRYRMDKYYVGSLVDPKTGKRTTDRSLELRLQTVGMDAQAKRHAELLMWAFPIIKVGEELDVNERFKFISQVIKLCPGNEEAWIELAAMANEDDVREEHRKQMTTILDQLFTTLGAFPDFTWKVFDDLIRFQPKEEDKIKLYQRLLQQYQQQKRPDLACEAALVLVNYLERADRKKEAVDGLANMIQMFPDEGRYVPRLLDRLEKICEGVEAAQPLVLAFYTKFLPMVPTKRGSRPSKYCISIHKRGIKRFRDAGQEQAANYFQQRLEKIEAGQL